MNQTIDAAFVLPVPKKDTLSSQVTRYLLDIIARKQLKPGDLAPSEVEICRELNVSRGIVREAYRSLATLGILEIESGKWPRVRKLSSTVLTQIVGFALRTEHVNALQVLQLRRAIEIEAARLAATYGTEVQFEHLRACVAEMRRARGDHQGMISADVALHVTLAEATHNPLFALMIEGLRAPLEDSMAVGLQSRHNREEISQVLETHDTLVERIVAGDGDGAASIMAHHFDASVTAILKSGMTATARHESTVERR